MNKKNINATLYMESRISWKKHENVVDTDPDGYLFADGKYRTKILPADLPEWFVYGYLYKRHGYISAKGVKHLLYVPNYTFDNHLHKYDTLYISYNEKIEPYESDHGHVFYKGYDDAIGGNLIIDFVRAAKKHSDYDINEIWNEILRKQDWYYEKHPEEREALVKSTLSKLFGRRLPYRGREYMLGGVAEKKPFFENAFCVHVYYTDKQIKAAVIRIYCDLARKDLNDKVRKIADEMNMLNITEITINGGKTTLGSYTKTLNFSWRLMMADDDVIDYVVACTLACFFENNARSVIGR